MNDAIQFDFFDRPRKLRFDVSACRVLFEDSGREFYDLFPAHWGPGSAALFLWAGLRSEDRRLTKDQVDTMMWTYITKGGKLADLTGPLNEAIEKSGFFQALRPKANGHHPDPPSGGGSKTDPSSSTEATASRTPGSEG